MTPVWFYVLIVLAFLCFLIAASKRQLVNADFTALGLALAVLAFLVR
jgi:hypothetical protein